MNPNRGKPDWVAACERAAQHMRSTARGALGCFPIIFRGFSITIADEFYGLECAAHNDNSGGDWG